MQEPPPPFDQFFKYIVDIRELRLFTEETKDLPMRDRAVWTCFRYDVLLEFESVETTDPFVQALMDEYHAIETNRLSWFYSRISDPLSLMSVSTDSVSSVQNEGKKCANRV